MVRALGPFTPLLIAALFLTANQGLMGSILSVRLAQLDASAQLAGLMTTAYFAGHVFGSRLGRRLLGRSGHLRGFAGMMAVSAISGLLIPLMDYPIAWLAFRFASGVSLVLAFLILESWLNMEASNTERGSVFGIYITVVYVGMTGGQAFLGLVDPLSFEAFSVSAIALMLAVLPMTLTRRVQPTLPVETRITLAGLARMSPVGIAACVASGALTGVIFGLFPYYASGRGFGTSEIAAFMSAVIGGGLVFNWPLGRLSDRIDRRWIIGAAGAGIAVASAILGTFGSGLAGLIAAGTVVGGATTVLYSIGVAHTNDHASNSDAIAVGAGLLFAFGLGAIAGPPLASVLMDLFAPAALFAFSGLTGGGVAAVALYRILQRSPVDSDDKGDFVPLAAAAAGPVALDATDEATAEAEAAPEMVPATRDPLSTNSGLPAADVARSTSAIAQSA